MVFNIHAQIVANFGPTTSPPTRPGTRPAANAESAAPNKMTDSQPRSVLVESPPPGEDPPVARGRGRGKGRDEVERKLMLMAPWIYIFPHLPGEGC